MFFQPIVLKYLIMNIFSVRAEVSSIDEAVSNK